MSRLLLTIQNKHLTCEVCQSEGWLTKDIWITHMEKQEIVNEEKETHFLKCTCSGCGNVKLFSLYYTHESEWTNENIEVVEE